MLEGHIALFLYKLPPLNEFLSQMLVPAITS